MPTHKSPSLSQIPDSKHNQSILLSQHGQYKELNNNQHTDKENTISVINQRSISNLMLGNCSSLQNIHTVAGTASNPSLHITSSNHGISQQVSNRHATAELPAAPHPRLTRKHVYPNTSTAKHTDLTTPPHTCQQAVSHQVRVPHVAVEAAKTNGATTESSCNMVVHPNVMSQSMVPDVLQSPTVIHYHLTIQNCDGIEIHVDGSDNAQPHSGNIKPKTVYSADGRKLKRLSWIEVPSVSPAVQESGPKVASVSPHIREPSASPLESPTPEENEVFISEEAERLFEGQEHVILEAPVGQPGERAFEADTMDLLTTSPYGMTEEDNLVLPSTDSVLAPHPSETGALQYHQNDPLRASFNPYDYDFMYEDLGDRSRLITEAHSTDITHNNRHGDTTDGHTLASQQLSEYLYNRYNAQPPITTLSDNRDLLFNFSRMRRPYSTETTVNNRSHAWQIASRELQHERQSEDEAVQTDVTADEGVTPGHHCQTRNAQCQTAFEWQQPRQTYSEGLYNSTLVLIVI